MSHSYSLVLRAVALDSSHAKLNQFDAKISAATMKYVSHSENTNCYLISDIEHLVLCHLLFKICNLRNTL